MKIIFLLILLNFCCLFNVYYCQNNNSNNNQPQLKKEEECEDEYCDYTCAIYIKYTKNKSCQKCLCPSSTTTPSVDVPSTVTTQSRSQSQAVANQERRDQIATTLGMIYKFLERIGLIFNRPAAKPIRHVSMRNRTTDKTSAKPPNKAPQNL
jgi:hypothetical protein